MNSVMDHKGRWIEIGNTVTFISGPNILQEGTVVGFKPLNAKGEKLVEIVIDLPSGKTFTLSVHPSQCARRS